MGNELIIKPGGIEHVYNLLTHIPEFTLPEPLVNIEKRISDKRHLIIYAFIEDSLAGFKLGYEIGPTEFYSWLGGIIPQYRRRGLAQKLLEFQENWALSSGFQHMKVKSKNRFPGMIKLLIKNGYHIKSLEETDRDILDIKICFTKTLVY